MKINLIVLSFGWLAGAVIGQDCPSGCSCSDGLAAFAHCTKLNSDMFFPERIKHLVLDSVPGLQINVTRAFFKNIGLQQVSTIKIKNCSIFYIDAKAFENLQELTDVNLSDNGLILIHPDTFHNNDKLQHLTLSGNPLQLTQLLQAEENYFLKSLSLLELDLSRCQLRDIGKKLLSQLPNLQYINLQGNNIKVIDDYTFENVPLLEEIDLSDNLLFSLNGGIFEDIEELTVLNLKNNLIENIDDLDLPGLKELDVSFNNIKMLRKNMFEGITDLNSLNVSHNGISWISEEAFKDLIDLRYLDLSQNALMGPLPKFIFEENGFLETLSLAGNKEMHIFEGFMTELPRLYNLDISDCGLSNITNSSFNGMPNIAILNISMNSLTSLNHIVMSKLHRLNVLDVSYNDITKVGTHTFASNSHLRKLNLSHNKIHNLSPNTFESTRYISDLDVSYNHFSHIWHVNDSEYMKGNKLLDQLEYLNIAGNRIKDLHKDSFGHLTSLKAVNVLDNPLECTSEFPAFIEWLYKNQIRPLYHADRTLQVEEKLEKSNLQWDDLLMRVCKLQTGKIDIKTTTGNKFEELENAHNLKVYQYTVFEGNQDKGIDHAALSDEKEKIAAEITTYIWATFLIVLFITLAIGNSVYRHRNQYNANGLKTTFVSPFKSTIVKLDTTPRYHKLYEECSVPNTPIVKSNLLGNLVTSQIKGTVLSKLKNDEV